MTEDGGVMMLGADVSLTDDCRRDDVGSSRVCAIHMIELMLAMILDTTWILVLIQGLDTCFVFCSASFFSTIPIPASVDFGLHSCLRVLCSRLRLTRSLRRPRTRRRHLPSLSPRLLILLLTNPLLPFALSLRGRYAIIVFHGTRG
jgi:hypothetical protein